jgi:hypothetical protein
MRSAIDMYQQIWPVFKHKFWAQTGRRLASAPNPFFSVTIESYEGYSIRTLFNGGLSADERDQNSFRMEREGEGRRYHV